MKTGFLAFHIAIRQLLNHSSTGFVRTVSFLTVLGIAIGVASMLLLQGLMTGFTESIRDNLMSFHPPVIISAPGGYPLSEEDILLVESVAESIDGAGTVSPSLERTAVASGRNGEVAGIVVRGIEWETEAEITRISDIAGYGFSGVAIGKDLAGRLGIDQGDSIRVASTRSISLSGTGRVLVDTIVVLPVGKLVDFGLEEFNSSFLFIEIDAARSIFKFPGAGTALGVGINEGFDPVEISSLISEKLRDVYVSGDHALYLAAESFISRHKNLFRALGLERLAMTIVLALITVVAMLNLSSTLAMIALEHRRSLGVLRTMGASPGFMVKLSLLQGLLVGLGGLTAGVILAIIGQYVINNIVNIGLEGSIYWVDSLPSRLRVGPMLITTGGILLACITASVIPAIHILSMSPSQAVRYE